MDGCEPISTTARGRVGRAALEAKARRAPLCERFGMAADIWLRRTVDLSLPPEYAAILLKIHHDDDAEVYLNGKLVKELKGAVGSYSPVLLDAKGARCAGRRPERHRRALPSDRGGQYIDVGLMELVER